MRRISHRLRPTITGVALLGLLLAACGDPGGSAGSPDDGGAAVDAGDDGTADDGAADDGAADDGTADDGATDDGTADDGSTTDGADGGPTTGPTPDPALVADPCGPHQGRELEGFIELVSPVHEQFADGTVEFVGCSNVFEATVNWRMLDGDGRTLSEGFVTAECGTGCVGAFRDTLDVSVGDGEPVIYFQVFTISAEDGSDQMMTEILILLPDHPDFAGSA